MDQGVIHTFFMVDFIAELTPLLHWDPKPMQETNSTLSSFILSGTGGSVLAGLFWEELIDELSRTVIAAWASLSCSFLEGFD